MATSDTIESMYENTRNAYDKVQEKGGTIPANKNLQNLASAIDSIVTGGSVSTQSQSIFTGYTAPLTWLNSTNNVFTYESATHNITISGLSAIATITGNGTKSVTVTIDTSSSSDRQTAFTITCVNGEQELTYNGIEFHYGNDVASGNCLVVAQTLINDQIGYIFIESASLPLFNSNTASWNSIYSHQIISFDFAKWSGTGTGNNFLYGCSSFNQPLTIPDSVTAIGDYFLNYCYSFNQPLTIPSGVTRSGHYFLNNCYSFNQPLTIPSGVTSIGTQFLYGCSSFNQPLTIPSGVTSIASSFLKYCYAFNQPLTIPDSVTRIDYGFMQNCYSFNQPLTIPSGVTSIGGSFLYECRSLIYLEYNASVYPTDNDSLSQYSNTKTSSSGTGIKVVGTGASGLKSALPNRTLRPFRKLV